MRDPGTPRRNPLFEQRARPDDAPPPEDAPPDDDEVPPEDALPEDALPPNELASSTNRHESGTRHDERESRAAPPRHDHTIHGGGGVCPLCSLGIFASTMREASPEAMDHLLGAAHEFLLAARVVLEAADRAIELQRVQLAAARAAAAAERSARAAAESESEPGTASATEAASPSEPRPRRPSSKADSARVQRIHLA